MTAASKVTLTRIFMIPVYLILMYISDGGSGAWMWGALGVFILASVTDFVDGYIARHCNQVSDFGKFLDPLADKLLVLAAMAMFCEWGLWPAWALMVVLAREFAVTGPAPGGGREGNGHCSRLVRESQNGQHHGGAVSADGISRGGASAVECDRRGGDHHLVFWRGVFRAELEMSLELNQALYDAVAI